MVEGSSRERKGYEKKEKIAEDKQKRKLFICKVMDIDMLVSLLR